MRLYKLLATTTVALLALILSLFILNQAHTDFPTPDKRPAQMMRPPEEVSSRLDLWLMPDYDNDRVWVYGEYDGTEHPTLPLKNDGMSPWSWPQEKPEYFFGWWEGSQVISISQHLTGAYQLVLPGLDLRQQDMLRLKLASGVILTDTLLSQPVSQAAAVTGTLDITLDFTPTQLLSTLSDAAITGTYHLTGLETVPATGDFVVSSSIRLTALYTLPGSSPDEMLMTASQEVSTSLPFTYQPGSCGEYTWVKLSEFARPVTLTVPFYPFEKAISLTLTPLLVETVMDPRASSTGGRVHRKLRGADEIRYSQAGMLGHGQVRLRVRGIAGDPERSAASLLVDYGDRRILQEQVGFNYWRDGLSRLLERHLDFPSFPDGNKSGYTVGELNSHKHTIVEILTRDWSYTLQDDPDCLTIEFPFTLQVWRVKDREVQGSYTPVKPSLGRYEYQDISSAIEDEELRIRLGQIVLGPQDVLTLTIKDVVWTDLEPPPDNAYILRGGDGSREQVGFSAIYHGPKTFLLAVVYKPQPTLLGRQSVSTVRGYSRMLEVWLADLAREWEISKDADTPIFPVMIIMSVLVVVLWGFYRRPVSSLKEDAASDKKSPPDWKKIGLRLLMMLFFLILLLQLQHAGLWRKSGETLSDLFHLNLPEAPMPFATLMVFGAFFLLMRFKGWRWHLKGIALLAVLIDIWLNTQYADSIRNALAFGSATGLLSGATSMAMLFVTFAFVGAFFWLGLREQSDESTSPQPDDGSTSSKTDEEKTPRQLEHDDLHAFAFASVASATFEVTDASLLSIGLLFLAWCALSIFIDFARPLDRVPTKVSGAQDGSEDSEEQSGSNSGPPPGEKQSRLRSIIERIVEKLRVLFSHPKPPAEDNQQTSDTDKPGDQPQGDKTAQAEGPPSLKEKLERLIDPLPIGAALVIAIYLSQDPLLHSQLASFAGNVLLKRGWTVFADPLALLVTTLADPLALLATTLTPCLAIVLLVVVLDTGLEHWRYRETGIKPKAIDMYFKAVPLFLVLFSVFVLGIGGLALFTGAFELRLADRIVYYLTVPLLTSIWLDWESQDGDKTLENLFAKLAENKRWLSLSIALLSILLPRLFAPVSPDQVDQVIQSLESLRF